MFKRTLLLVTLVAFLSSCATTKDDIVDKADSFFKKITGQPDVVEVEDRTTSSDSAESTDSTEENVIAADSSAYKSQSSEQQVSSTNESSTSSSDSSSGSESSSSSSTDSEASKVVIIEKSPLEKLKDTGVTFTLYFKYDGYDIDENSTKEIIEHANFMRDNPDVRLRLVGHADERGTREYNLALGENRALSVKEVLGLYELSSRIDVVSYGEERPISTVHDESGWKQNRRVEFVYD
jgi:peptidoglycan-associated lipoprotein